MCQAVIRGDLLMQLTNKWKPTRKSSYTCKSALWNKGTQCRWRPSPNCSNMTWCCNQVEVEKRKTRAQESRSWKFAVQAAAHLHFPRHLLLHSCCSHVHQDRVQQVAISINRTFNGGDYCAIIRQINLLALITNNGTLLMRKFVDQQRNRCLPVPEYQIWYIADKVCYYALLLLNFEDVFKWVLFRTFNILTGSWAQSPVRGSAVLMKGTWSVCSNPHAELGVHESYGPLAVWLVRWKRHSWRKHEHFRMSLVKACRAQTALVSSMKAACVLVPVLCV